MEKSVLNEEVINENERKPASSKAIVALWAITGLLVAIVVYGLVVFGDVLNSL